LLVAMAVEQHRVVAPPRYLHQDEWRAALEPHDLHAQPFDRACATPLLDQGDRAVEVAVRRPLGIEHRRLRGDRHVLGERGQDVAVPRLLHERQRACGVERHYFFAWGGFFACSATQMRSGFRGMSRCLTPSGLSASTTALTTAGVLPIVAASPMPLAPMGLNGVGVVVWSGLHEGRSSGCGTASSISQPVTIWLAGQSPTSALKARVIPRLTPPR